MAIKLERIVKTYYDNLEQGKILGRYCPKCGNMEWPPVYACNACGNMYTEYREISGKAVITNFVLPSVMSLKPQLKDLEPYGYAMVKLEEGTEKAVMVCGIDKNNEKEIRAHLPYPVHAIIVQRDGYKTAVFALNGFSPAAEVGNTSGAAVAAPAPVVEEAPAVVEEETPAAANFDGDVLAQLIPIVARSYHVDPSTVTADTKFTDFKAQSVIFVGLVASLEDEFDIMISITEASAKAKTVGQLAELVTECME